MSELTPEQIQELLYKKQMELANLLEGWEKYQVSDEQLQDCENEIKQLEFQLRQSLLS